MDIMFSVLWGVGVHQPYSRKIHPYPPEATEAARSFFGDGAKGVRVYPSRRLLLNPAIILTVSAPIKNLIIFSIIFIVSFVIDPHFFSDILSLFYLP